MTFDWKTIFRRLTRGDYRFSVILAALLLFLPSAWAQEREIRIGISPWISTKEFNDNIIAFKKRLELVGFVEGKNTIYYQENALGDPQKQAQIIQSFVQKKVDLIYSLGTSGTLIAKNITKEIPIVFSISVFPMETGIIKSLASSENNCVGTRNYISVGKQLEVLLSIVPEIRSIGVIHLKEDPDSTIRLERMKEITKVLGIQVIDMAASDLNQLQEILNEKADAYYLTCDTLIQNGGEEIAIDAANKRKIPTLSCNRSGILKGALVGDVVDLESLGTASGKKAAAILNGEKPTDIITETQQGSYVMINLKTANLLGLPTPYQALSIASEIIQE